MRKRDVREKRSRNLKSKCVRGACVLLGLSLLKAVGAVSTSAQVIGVYTQKRKCITTVVIGESI